MRELVPMRPALADENVNNCFKNTEILLAGRMGLARMRAPKAQPPQRSWQIKNLHGGSSLSEPEPEKSAYAHCEHGALSPETGFE